MSQSYPTSVPSYPDTTGGTLFLAPDHVVAYASASDYEEIATTVAAAVDENQKLPNLLIKDKLS